MTREEAINFLKGYLVEEVYTEKCRNAHEMAIKALEQDFFNDCISRAYVEPIVEELENICINGDEHILSLLSNIKNAPSVTLQPKKGHWIVEVWNNREHHTCSVCQRVVDYEPCYHYCPYCGAEMESD